MKRIVVGFPEDVLADIDDLLSDNNQKRSDIIRKACTFYIQEKRKALLREKLKVGYQEMAEINRLLAEETANDFDFHDDFQDADISYGWRKV